MEDKEKKAFETDEKVERILARLSKEPDYVDQVILNNCKAYIFYNKKKNMATCSHCGSEYGYDDVISGIRVATDGYDGDVEHGYKVRCPVCGKEAIAHSNGLSRNKLEDNMRVAYWRKKGKTLYLTIQLVDITYHADELSNLTGRPSGTPKIKKHNRALYIYGKGEPEYYKYSWHWNKEKNVHYLNEGNGMSYYPSRYGEDLYIRDSIIPLIKNSYYKYMPESFFVYDAVYEQMMNELYRDICTMRDFQKLPAVEVLIKTGFTYLVDERIYNEGPKSVMNWRSNKLTEIFRANRDEIKEIKRAMLSLVELKKYRDFKKSGDYLSAMQIKIINLTATWDFRKITETMELSKAYKYVNEKVVNQDDDDHRRIGIILHDYGDYLDDCRALDLDMERKDILFPKDFYKAHEETALVAAEIKDKENTKEFQACVKKVIDISYIYHNDKYMIRPAKSPSELRREGSSMGHCVGGYSRNVINGSSIIIFIRKTNNPNKSFVTMEIDAKTLDIKQIRAKSNADPSEEVKKFAEDWLEMFKTEKAKAKKRKRT